MTSKTDGSVTASYVEAQIQNRASKTLRQALSKSALRSQIRACRSFLLAPVSRMLRINSRTAHRGGLHDLLALRESGGRPTPWLIPKCEIGGNHTTRPEVLGGAQLSIGIVPMVERARSSFIADDMAKAHERVCGLFFGGGNLTTDPDAEGSSGKLAFARSWIGAAAASIRITVVFTRSLEAVPRAGPVMAANATSGAGTPDLAGEILCR